MRLPDPLITVSDERLSGKPLFAGTRVPVQTLIDYLEGGETIDEFLDGFPTVGREQVIAFLQEAKQRMLAAAAARALRSQHRHPGVIGMRG